MADLKDAVNEAMLAPSGQGTMVQLYGTYLPCLPPPLSDHDESPFCAGLGKVAGALAPSISGQIATAFLDTLYKA